MGDRRPIRPERAANPFDGVSRGPYGRGVFRLFRLISYPQLRSSWGRTLLVIGGVATGVALMVAINIVNTSVLANFRETIELIAGPAQLQVTLGVGEIGFPEEVVEKVRAVHGVAAAVPLVRGTVSLAADPTSTLQLFGADLTAENDLARYQLSAASDRREALRSMDDPRSILLTADFAGRNGIGVGDTIALSTPTGVLDLTVRGLLAASGVATAFDGRIAIMDLTAAQLALGKRARIDEIDVMTAPDESVDDLQKQLQAAVGDTLTVQRPEQRGREYERVLGSFQAMLAGLSSLCLVAGIYIVYNTTATAAVHRSYAIALLRVVGAPTSALFALMMLEAGVLGLLGTVLGTVQGIILARLLSGMVSDSMGVIFQLRFPVSGFAIRPFDLAAIAAIGIGSALFASYFAARWVSGLDPLEVRRRDLRTIAASRPSRPLIALWLLLVALAVVALIVEVQLKSIAWGNAGSTLWCAASILIAIPMVNAVAARLSWVFPRMFSAEGRIAAESLFRSPARTGITIGAIALVFTVGITVSSIALSFRESVNRYFGAGFLASDLIVSAVATEGGWLETPLPEAVATEIAALPGVRSVEMLRVLPGQMFRGERIAIAGVSDGLVDPARHPSGWYREGNPESAAEGIRNGTGARISTSLADRVGMKLGDRFELASPTGPVTLTVVGVVPDYMSDRGGVGISRRMLVERWRESAVSRISVFVDPGTDPKLVADGIRAKVGERYRLKILSLGELVAYHASMIDRAFAFTDAIQLLIAIVTVAGIFDLLLSAIIERRRELALWRVVGADESTVRRSVVLESVTVGALGSILGIGVGVVTTWIWVGINFPYLLGYYLDFHLAVGTAAWYVTLVMAMTALAGYLAANHATRQPIIDGIQAE